MIKLLELRVTPLTLELSQDKHPNEMSFKGILVRLDEPSTKAPNGSDGHRILVSTSVAKRRLSTLIGMGLNYAEKLNAHNQKHKVGVIKKAWIEGRDLWVSGVIWKHDFPEAEYDLKKPNLGMSMELGSVQVEDQNAETWMLSDFYFLGATILDRNAAAYHKTLAIAAKAEERSNRMSVVKKGSKSVTTTAGRTITLTPGQVASIAAKAAQTVGDGIRQEMQDLRSFVSTRHDMQAAEDELSAIELDAGKTEETEAAMEDEEACDMSTKKLKAAKGKKMEDPEDEEDDEDDDEDDMESVGDVSDGDLEKMGPDTEDADLEDEPGQLNKGAKNMGDKTTSQDKVGKNENKPVTGSAIAAAMKLLKRSLSVTRKQSERINALVEANAKMSKRLKKYEVQASKFGADVARRSNDSNQLAPELSGLLAKSGINAAELQQSGQKLSAQDVDAILAAAGIDFDVTKRIEVKNKLKANGMMEDGVVNR